MLLWWRGLRPARSWPCPCCCLPSAVSSRAPPAAHGIAGKYVYDALLVIGIAAYLWLFRLVSQMLISFLAVVTGVILKSP